jgi:hypothetical protein
MAETAVTLEMQAGEGKWFKFTVTKNGAELDCSSASDLFFAIQKVGESSYVHSVEKANFDVSQAANGILRCNLPKSVSKNMSGTYDCGVEITLTADTDVEQRTFKLKVKSTLLTSRP